MGFTVRVKVRKAGGSLVMTIPKRVVEAMDLHAGDRVAITITRRRESGAPARERTRTPRRKPS